MGVQLKKRILGTTDIEVSEICLGTMTWGQQNSQEEGFEQMDYVLDCLLYTSPSPRDRQKSRMPSSA